MFFGLQFTNIVGRCLWSLSVGSPESGRIQGGGGTWVMTPPWGPGAPQACQGHHRPIRGTTGLTGAPQARQGHHRPSKGTTGLSGAPQACQEHHRPSKSTTGLPGAPQTYQEGHQRPARGTTGLSGALKACQGHHSPVRAQGTSGLAGAPQARQGHVVGAPDYIFNDVFFMIRCYAWTLFAGGRPGRPPAALRSTFHSFVF